MKKYLPVFILLFFAACRNGQNPTEETSSNEPSDSVEVKIFETIWHYEDDFSKDEKSKVEEWITMVYSATTEVLGEYPFDLHVYFHRTKSNSAVTFGHTDRGKDQAVHFYVNPTYSMDELLADWIAPHEISHLSMPFVGRSSKWYAEGYATYLSRRIMMQMDLMEESAFDSMYYSKIHACMSSYCSTSKTFIEVSDSLLGKYEYGDMYWGSTSFFMTSDSLLRQHHNIRFTDLVAEYQTNGRLEDESLREVIHSYDEIIQDTLFTQLMKRYRNLPSGEVMKGY